MSIQQQDPEVGKSRPRAAHDLDTWVRRLLAIALWVEALWAVGFALLVAVMSWSWADERHPDQSVWLELLLGSAWAVAVGLLVVAGLVLWRGRALTSRRERCLVAAVGLLHLAASATLLWSAVRFRNEPWSTPWEDAAFAGIALVLAAACFWSAAGRRWPKAPRWEDGGLGLVALVLAVCGASIAALVLAYLVRGRDRRHGSPPSTVVTAAIVIGWVGVAVTLVFVSLALPVLPLGEEFSESGYTDLEPR